MIYKRNFPLRVIWNMEGWNWITSLCFRKHCLPPSFHHGHHHLLVALVKFLFLLSFLYLYVKYITLLEYFTIFNNPFGFISKMYSPLLHLLIATGKTSPATLLSPGPLLPVGSILSSCPNFPTSSVYWRVPFWSI